MLRSVGRWKEGEIPLSLQNFTDPGERDLEYVAVPQPLSKYFILNLISEKF